jgi:CDP-6-deoxy-D-xylo-4-hexulose-3-dehydrase
MQAAFGFAQLPRLDQFLATRTRNFNLIREALEPFEEMIILPQSEKGATSHWLAFPITFRAGCGIDRNAFVRHLEANKIQTRPLFSGNITRHPAYTGVGRSVGRLPHSTHILGNSLLVGLHHGMTDDMRNYALTVITDYLRSRQKS